MIEKIEGLDIKKQFNARFTLSCSLTIEKGPLFTIVGPNGSGKSALLRMLALIDRPDSGNIIYYDDGAPTPDPCKNIEVRRKTVLVPTRAGLFNETVFNNIAYGLRLRGFSRDKVKDCVMDVLQTVRLAGREHSHAFELSSGEAQRLALARALAIDPEVLMLDEPTASLDPEATKMAEEIIMTRMRSSQRINIMVTHSLHQARALSDIMIFMYAGKVIEMSDAESFFESPSDDLTRRFVAGEVY